MLEHFTFTMAFAWKTIWLPAAVGGTAGLVQLTKAILSKIPPVVLPLYSVGVGIGLAYLSQVLGIDLPTDPALSGLAAGAAASSAFKVAHDASGIGK